MNSPAQYMVYVPVDKRRDSNPYIGPTGHLVHPETKEVLLFDMYAATAKAKLFDGVHVRNRPTHLGANKVEMVTIPKEEYLDLLRLKSEIEQGMSIESLIDVVQNNS